MLYVALLLACLSRSLRPRSAVLLENLALRQQLAVYQRRGARPPAPRWGSALLVAARTDVARLAFATAVRPARDRDSVASHGVAPVLDVEEPQTRAWSPPN
jgi:hypothetical protein